MKIFKTGKKILFPNPKSATDDDDSFLGPFLRNLTDDDDADDAC
jgi:hypothetical protein